MRPPNAHLASTSSIEALAKFTEGEVAACTDQDVVSKKRFRKCPARRHNFCVAKSICFAFTVASAMALPVELQFLNTRKGQGGLATLLSLAFATTFLVLFLDLPEEAHTMNSTTAALKMKLSSIPDAPSSHGHFIQIHRIKKPAIILSYFPSSDSHNDFYETLRLQGRFAAAARGMEVYKV